jgi:hypothetical protein
MDTLGHCIVAIRSGRFESERVFGDGLHDLLLPNLLHCHDWAYSRMWDLSVFPPELRQAGELVRCHMVADWIIHYGTADTSRKKKCGWAYRSMAIAWRAAPRFFGDAATAGLLQPDCPLPDSWSKKQWLDFSHSVIEYGLDVMLADEISDRDFERMRGALAALGGCDAGSARAALRARFCALGAFSDQDDDFLERSVDAYVRCAANSDRPDYFPVFTLMQKYRFVENDESVRYVRRFLHEVASGLERRDTNALLDEIVRGIVDPATLFTGALTAPAIAREACNV